MKKNKQTNKQLHDSKVKNKKGFKKNFEKFLGLTVQLTVKSSNCCQLSCTPSFVFVSSFKFALYC